MKRFLLVFGILLCMQCCTLARNLYDFGNGFYVDLDSLRSDGNYGYALIEYHSSDSCFNLLSLEEFDLLNSKVHSIKGYLLDNDNNVVDIREEFELPQIAKEWDNIPENTPIGEILEALKKIEPTNDIK